MLTHKNIIFFLTLPPLFYLAINSSLPSLWVFITFQLFSSPAFHLALLSTSPNSSSFSCFPLSLPPPAVPLSPTSQSDQRRLSRPLAVVGVRGLKVCVRSLFLHIIREFMLVIITNTVWVEGVRVCVQKCAEQGCFL